MIFFSYKWSSCSRGGGGGGGGGAGTKCMEYIRVSTPRMVGPFFTVIELVPRVLILQIIGQ